MLGLEHDVLVQAVEAAFGNKESKKSEISTEASKYAGMNLWNATYGI